MKIEGIYYNLCSVFKKKQYLETPIALVCTVHRNEFKDLFYLRRRHYWGA